MKQLSYCSLLLLLLVFPTGIYAQTEFSVNREVIVRWETIPTAQEAKQIEGSSQHILSAGTSLTYVQSARPLNPEEEAAWLTEIRNIPGVRYAEPNYTFSATELPNDPSVPNQWAWQDIGMETVWQTAQTGEAVVIGMIDTGLDYSHEDLQDNVFQNLAEDSDGDGHTIEWVNGKWVLDPGDLDGIDNDGNGYIDDLAGWDFVNNDNDPFDDNGHGTHVAGVMSAQSDNGIGISGINANAKILAIKSFGKDGSGTLASILPGLAYARMMGVDLTNNSWGGGRYSQFLYEEIEAARQANQIFVAAAGNSRKNIDLTPVYPAAYPHLNIVSVASLNKAETLSSFSNYGSIGVDIVAPGEEILSTLPNNRYGYKSGTSMAAPQVAGALSILIGQTQAENHQDIIRQLLNNAQTADAGLLTVSKGKLNVATALLAPKANRSVIRADFQIIDKACLGTELQFQNQGSNSASHTWYVDGQLRSHDFHFAHTFTQSGLHEIKLVVQQGVNTDEMIQQVYLAAPPRINIDLDRNVCAEQLVLDAKIEGLSYQWSDMQGNALSYHRTYTATRSGMYQLQIKDGCDQIDKKVVNVALDGDCVWPGDVNADGRVNSIDFIALHEAYDENKKKKGEKRKEKGILWKEYEAKDWKKDFSKDFDLAPDLNLKHADCDGDGKINKKKDLTAIQQNLSYPPMQEAPVSSEGMIFTLRPVATVFTGKEQVLIEYEWGFEGIENLKKDLEGLSIQLAFNLPIADQPDFTFTNKDLKKAQVIGLVRTPEQSAAASINGLSYSMEIGVTQFKVKNSLTAGKFGVIVTVDDITEDPSALDFASFSMQTVKVLAIDKHGSLLPVNTEKSMAQSTVLLQFGSDTENINAFEAIPNVNQSLQIAPNPNTGQFQVVFEASETGSTLLQLHNAVGQVVWEQTANSEIGVNQLEVSTQNLSEGMYFLRYQDANGAVQSQPMMIR